MKWKRKRAGAYASDCGRWEILKDPTATTAGTGYRHLWRVYDNTEDPEEGCKNLGGQEAWTTLRSAKHDVFRFGNDDGPEKTRPVKWDRVKSGYYVSTCGLWEVAREDACLPLVAQWHRFDLPQFWRVFKNDGRKRTAFFTESGQEAWNLFREAKAVVPDSGEPSPDGPSHYDLVKRAGRWLRGTGGCRVVLTEFHCYAYEIPDAIGWKCQGTHSILVECKTTRGELPGRQEEVAPKSRPDGRQTTGPLRSSWGHQAEDLPEGRGLLEWPGGVSNVRCVVEAPEHRDDKVYRLEIPFLFSVARRAQLTKETP